MNNLNLFPYRDRAIQNKVSRFQRELVLSGVVSLLLAVGLGFMLRDGGGLLLDNSSNRQHLAVNEALEMRSGVERAWQWLETIEPLKTERAQRLQVLRLLHSLSMHPVEGVFLGPLDWSADGLEVVLWAVSPTNVSAWLQRVQAMPGFESAPTHELWLDAPPNPLGLPSYRVRMQLTDQAARP